MENKKETNTLRGFAEVAKSLANQANMPTPPNIDIDDIDEGASVNDEILDAAKTVAPEPEPVHKSDEVDDDYDEPKDTETNDEEDVELEENSDTDTDTDDDTEVSELGDIESDVVSFFMDKFSSELSMNLSDDERPKTVKEVIDFISETIEYNSRPSYASEDIEKLNDFVSNGGDLKEFFNQTYGDLDLNKANLESETTQKAVIKELLKEKGYSDSYISKKLTRYEDSGVLEEEAEEAMELLKDIRSKNEEKLLQEQKNKKELAVKQQQDFLKNVYKTIDNLGDVRGIKVSDRDRQKLKKYMFEVDSSGTTAYQRDYSKNLIHLIESAYFTMEGDTIINKINKREENKAVINLQKKLKNKKESNKKTKSDRPLPEGGNTDIGNILSTFSKQLI